MTYSPPRVIVLVGALLLVAHLAAMAIFRKPDGRVVFGDATHHFVQLRSMVFDRDLHFQNEYTRLYKLEGETAGVEWVTSELTPTGHVRNYMPVGPALLWLPLYLLVVAVQWALASVGLVAPPDGYERWLQMVPGVTGTLATVGASLVSWRTARRFVDDWSAAVGVLGLWLGTHAIYYSLVSPAYSHAASMFATSLFVWRWLATRDAPSLGRIASWGALAGLAALMRWQDAVFLGVVAIEILRWRAPFGRRVMAGALALAACAAVFSPQMVVWTVLYGQPLAIPQGASFMQWTRPHLVDVLVSSYHGLFSWAPLAVLAVAGLVSLARRHRALALPLLALALVSWYVNAAVADWWAGEAYGARRFLSLFPFGVLGLSWWLHRDGHASPARSRVALVGVFVGLNLLLLLQYQLYMKGLAAVAPYPTGFYDMYVARFVVPFHLAARWLSGS